MEAVRAEETLREHRASLSPEAVRHFTLVATGSQDDANQAFVDALHEQAFRKDQ